jgi:hypothetical protein
MNGRGAVEIIVAEIALAQGLIDQDVFSILVFMAIFTTATVPILLTLGVRWLRRRGELVKAGKRTGTVIVGAGAIARALGTALMPAMPVTLIDTNRANQRAGRREGLAVRPGSGLDELVLENAEIDSALRLVAATPNAEVNVLTAQLAVDLGVPHVSVLLRDSDARTFSVLLGGLAIDVIRAPEDIPDWEHAVSIGEARTEIAPVVEALDLSRNNSEAPWPTDPAVFPLVVISNNERFPYTSDTRLSSGNEVLLVTRPGVVAFAPSRGEVVEDVPTQP